MSINSIPYRENANKVISAVGTSIEKTTTEVNVVSNANTNTKVTQSLSPLANENTASRSIGKKSQTPILLKKNCVLSGKITKIINSNRIMIKYGDRDIMLTLRKNEGALLKVGDNVTASCLPYKEDRSGIVLASANYIKKQ